MSNHCRQINKSAFGPKQTRLRVACLLAWQSFIAILFFSGARPRRTIVMNVQPRAAEEQKEGLVVRRVTLHKPLSCFGSKATAEDATPVGVEFSI
jgi:hypothetical protein